MGGSGQVRNLFRNRIGNFTVKTRRNSRRITNAQPQHATRSPSRTLLWKNNANSTISIRTFSSVSNAPTNQPSSSSNNNDNNRNISNHSNDLAELHRWAETVLNPHRTPLGSLDAAAWNDIMTAMQFFLDDTTTTAPPPPRHVDLCDKLLARLWMEHKSCGGGSRRRTSPLRHQQQQHWLHAWSAALRDAWLRVARQHPRAPLPVQRARVWWEQQQQQQPAASGRDSNDTLAYAQQLVEAELRLAEAQPDGSPHAVPACLRATEMLLSNALLHELLEDCAADHHQSTASTAEAATAFKEYYRQAVRLNLHHFSVCDSSDAEHNNLSLAVSNLLEQMEQLSQQSGWENVRFENEELDQILDTLFLETSSSDSILAPGNDTNKSLSDFEQQALRQRILARIRNTTHEEDEATVEELVQFWRNNMDQVSAELAQEVAAYYLRIEDPEKSTKWLQIQEGLLVAASSESTSDESLAESDQQIEASSEVASGVAFDADQSGAAGTSERERYEQKVNLLNVWVSKTDAPSAPYRATEILESLEAEGRKTQQQLDAKPYISIVRMWLEQPGGSQKALKIATRCPVFDPTLLSLVFKALTKEHKSGRINRETATKMVYLWKRRYDDIPSNMHSSLAENASVMMAAGGMEQGHELVQFLLDRGESLPAVVCEHAVRASPPNKVVEVVDLLESKSNSLATITFDCYRFAIFRLLQGNAPLTMIQDFFPRVLQAAKTVEPANSKNGEVADMFLEILRRGQEKDKSALGDLLLKTEEVLVDSSTFSSDTTSSPISLEFFRKVFHLFERNQMLAEMEKLFLRLKGYHQKGLEDLHPDGSTYNSYARLLQKVQSVDSLDKRLELLTELVNFYEASGKAPQYKPSYDMVGGVFAGLRLRCKTYRKSDDDKKAANENYERDTRTALSLVDKMHQLQIVPENLDRVYVFNITMEMVLGTQNKETCFETVMDLKRKMLDLGLQPNHLTHIAIVRAAELAPPRRAVPVTLESLAAIRRANKADAPLYMSCFRTLLRRKNQDRGIEAAASLDKIAAMVFECCCNDGALTTYVRKGFQRLCSNDTVDRLYTKRLEKDSKEPASWTRKAGSHF